MLSALIGAVLGGLLVLAAPTVLAQIGGNPAPQAPSTAQPAAPSAPSVTVPTTLSYQGKLLQPGTILPKSDGAYPMTFLIYDQPTAGSLLWSEVQSVPVKNGLFFAHLGSVTPIPAAIFTGQNLWLTVAVSSDPEMTPRQLLTSVAYAQRAENANTANNSTNFSGLSIDNFFKTFSGVQFTQGTPLAAGANEYVFTFSWPSSWVVNWRAIPTTNAGKVKLDLEIEYVQSNDTYTYWLRVTNTGAVATTYQLKYDVFYH